MSISIFFNEINGVDEVLFPVILNIRGKTTEGISIYFVLISYQEG